jgi:hypothetical protein
MKKPYLQKNFQKGKIMKKERSDLLEIPELNPAYTAVYNADFVPVTYVVEELYLAAFVDDKNICTFFIR